MESDSGNLRMGKRAKEMRMDGKLQKGDKCLIQSEQMLSKRGAYKESAAIVFQLSCHGTP
jgi:hypothetical protein